MVGWIHARMPLVFESKLLCVSLLYLLTTLALSLYVSFSKSGCVFPSPPELPKALGFSYPSGYGEHKYALPVPAANCSSPVPFSEYEDVVEEIGNACRNLSSPVPPSPALRYMQGKARTFAGNFSTKKRKSFFDHRDDRVEVPCGFLKKFPIKESDRSAMEKCNGVVVLSAIFGDHDKVRQPKGIGSQTLHTVCFFMFMDDVTLRSLRTYNIVADVEGKINTIGAWRIVSVPRGGGGGGRLPYDNPAMNGVIPKHLVHRLFPNAKFSIWLDAKLQLTVDPLLLLHSLVISQGADMAVAKHPFNVHTMEEAVATARWKKWGDVEGLRLQMETYCENGLQPWSRSKDPYTTDVPDTALIIRKHGLESNLFSCLLFNELEAFNPRDQLAFAYVRDLLSPKININMFEAEVLEHISIEYRHNLKHNNAAVQQQQQQQQEMKMASSRDISGSSCEGYLLKMWGESTD